MPGITTHWRATADRLGSYPVVCNLLCGVGHSLMRSTVHVVTPEHLPGLDREPSSGGSGSHQRRPVRTAGGGDADNVRGDGRRERDELMAARLRAPGFYRAGLHDARRGRLRDG